MAVDMGYKNVRTYIANKPEVNSGALQFNNRPLATEWRTKRVLSNVVCK